jgi:DNA polymerase-3 subunit delta'
MNIPYPWHSDLADHIARLYADQRLPHALLLTGRPGWGEIEFANWLGAFLLGSDAGGASTLAHPDLRWIEAEDGGREIKIDQIRALNEFAYGTVQAAQAKVAIIADADRMNRAAANAMLKTLEEPPRATFLLLTSTRAGRLPATILSRCQRFEIEPAPDEAQIWLADSVGAQQAQLLLEEFGNAPLKAARNAEAGMPSIEQLTNDLAGKKSATVLTVLADYDMSDLVERWQRMLVKRLVEAPDPALFEFSDELTAFLRQVENSNSANVKLLLERLAHRWRAVSRRA